MVEIILICVVIIGLAAIFMIREIRRELQCFETVHFEIQSPKLRDMDEKKIIFLSDLHNHVYGEENGELLDAIKKEEPDFIFIGGDVLVSNDKQSYMPALQFVKKLAPICPVYYANGNHEQRLKEKPEKYNLSYAAYRRILQEAGAHFLENDSQEFDWNGIPVRLTGLEIPLGCYKHFRNVKLYEHELEEIIGESKENVFEILMAHNPTYVNVYREWGADLILSGHLHGGTVRLPVIGGIIAPNFHIFPKYSGDMYEVGDTTVVVSKGLGTHTINIRLFNPAELVVLHLKGKLV